MDNNRNRSSNATDGPGQGSLSQAHQRPAGSSAAPVRIKKTRSARINDDEVVPSSSQNHPPITSDPLLRAKVPQKSTAQSGQSTTNLDRRNQRNPIFVSRDAPRSSIMYTPVAETPSASARRVDINIPRGRDIITPSSGRGRMRSSLPSRKHASALSAPFSPQSLPSSSAPSVISIPSKSTKLIVPLWQLEDEEYESTRATKRMRQERENAAGVDGVKRISVMSSRMGRNRRVSDPELERQSQRRESSYLAPRLKLTGDGMDADSPEESDVEMEEVRPQQAQAAKKSTGASNITQNALKMSAARKLKTIPASSSESSSSVADSSSEHESEDEDGVIQRFPMAERSATTELEVQTGKLKVEDEDVLMFDPENRRYGPPEIIYLDSPPPISIELPQLEPSSSDEMPELLIGSLSKLLLPSLLMQREHKLPFLLKSLRKGFKWRCKQLGIPVSSGKGKSKEEEVLVSYEGAGNLRYETRIAEWLCPLCELFGKFNTREMLAFHLTCDHSEVYIEWRKIENGRTWNLNILIPEEIIEEPSEQMVVLEEEALQFQTRAPSVQEPVPEPVDLVEPFPLVALSSPSNRARSPRASITAPSEPKWKRSMSPPATNSRHTTLSVSTSSLTRTTGTPSTSVTVGRSTTMMTAQGAWGDELSRYPTPPPPDDPLGPSARPPYLPAKSDYNGPTVHYSSRPTGPCLFDLLQTLPMEEFGVLDWAVIDREEEIYESDDMKEEHKVMHALWARWIMLNRNKFIANYYKGTIAFVDHYWKMIHRAAGWDALRQWLLILMANRFLTAKEIKEVLKHYESYTGMDYW